MGTANLLDMGVDNEEMGRRIAQARDDAGMTTFDLAIATGINDSQLRKYLRGESEPRAGKLALLAEVLGVNADWLLQNTDNPAPVPDVWVEGESPDRRATPPTGGGGPPPGSVDPPKRNRRSQRRSA